MPASPVTQTAFPSSPLENSGSPSLLPVSPATQQGTSICPLPSRPKSVPLPSVHPMITRSKSKQLCSSPHALLSALEPNSVDEALSDPCWTQAMEEEFSALQRNNTWELVPASQDMNLIGCKWVFQTT